MKSKRVVIIGGGLVGLATAYKLGQRCPSARLTVLEKESRVCAHQSGHNSGVLHAGLYYQPGSLKARLAVEGIREMVAFCQAHGIPHEICGKLVVAAEESEVPRLRELYARGVQNGLQGLRWLGPKEMREIEPHVGGVAAVHVPQEGIVDYRRVGETLRTKVEAQGSQVALQTKVISLRSRTGGWWVETTRGEFEADYLVNCAGLHSDRISTLAGERRPVRIVPFRGEYYTLRPERAGLVRHLIYPVPDPQYPFLGVHFTRLIQGGVEAGPNAVLAWAREGYRKTDVSVGDVWDAITFPGLWRFLGQHQRMSWEELKRSLSRRRFCASLQKLVPAICPADLRAGSAGVRAQAMSADGTLIQDFCLVESRHALHVLNAPSPGATACLTIGQEIARRVQPQLE